MTAHLDTFVRDRLPPACAWPSLAFESAARDYPSRLNCAVELLDRRIAAGQGERPALRTLDAVCSYRQLQQRVDAIAHALRERLGVLPGNRVLLRGWNHPMLVACWLAVAKAGGVAVTGMPLLRARELGQMIDRARIQFALCDARLADELTTACRAVDSPPRVLLYRTAADGDPGGTSGLDAMLSDVAPATPFVAVDTAADDPLLIAFTSGTTGAPKAAVHSHRDVLAACDLFPPAMLAPTPDDIFCGTPPLGFTYGLGALLCFPLRHGASSLLIEQPTPADLLTAIAAQRATICFTVPTFWRRMAAEAALGACDLSSLRRCVSAGEPLPTSTRTAWRAAGGPELIDGLGSTELLHIFVSHRQEEARPGAIGRAVPGYRLAILDAAGRPLPTGSEGRLAVRGPTGCRYLDDPRQREYVVDGWNLTGDIGRLDDDGYFHFRSRADDLIVSAGYNIAAVEVEEALLQHPAVLECGVVGVPDAARGQCVKAYVVTRPGHAATASLAAALQDFVKRRIAPYKYPRIVEFVDALPRTETSKLQRYRLRATATVAEESS